MGWQIMICLICFVRIICGISTFSQLLNYYFVFTQYCWDWHVETQVQKSKLYFIQSDGSQKTLNIMQVHKHTHTILYHILAQHAGHKQQADMQKQGGRSEQTKSKHNTARKSRVLTNGNDYPQNGYCDVVTYEVAITCSWDEQKEKGKKIKYMHRFVTKHPSWKALLKGGRSLIQQRSIMMKKCILIYLHYIRGENPSYLTLDYRQQYV